MPISWAMWAIGRRGWTLIRWTRVSLPAGVSRALAWAMRPPVSAVPSDSPHLTRRPHLTSTTSMGRTPSSVILQQQRISEGERRGAVVDDLDRRRDIPARGRLTARRVVMRRTVAVVLLAAAFALAAALPASAQATTVTYS